MAGAGKTALSLFVDDTHAEPPGALAPFLDFAQAQGLAGKLSLIAGLGAGPDLPALGLPGRDGPEVRGFLAGLAQAAGAGFDLHMELMTHAKLWDFARGGPAAGGPCEGIWLYDPAEDEARYRAYFEGILDHAARLGLALNGLSVPGCDCADCHARYQALLARGQGEIAPAVWQALLALACEGRFGVPAVALYVDMADPGHPTRIMARRGGACVFDARLDISVEDRIGFDGQADVDFYITADGRRGKIAELVRAGAPQAFFCAHWFAMNPTRADNWAAFQEIIRRINRHLGPQIAWQRPSAFGARLMAAAQ